MAKRRDNGDDTKPLLLLDNAIEIPNHFYCPSSSNPAISKGVVIQLAKWPNHIFTIFITASLILIAFLVATFIGFFFLSKDMKEKYRVIRNVDIINYPNIYFVGHVNRSWSLDDLCAIESSARDYPNLKVYLVNLYTQQPLHFFKTVNLSKSQESVDGIIEATVNKLTTNYINIRNMNIVDGIFFKKTVLEKYYKKFDEKILEIAVKAHLLWGNFGIALNPSKANHLKNLENYMCRLGESYDADKIALLSIDGSIQVSTIPCHAFYGHLLKKISSKYISKNFIKEVYKSFCLGQDKCSGVKIMSNKSRNIMNRVLCPTVFPEDTAKFNI